MSEPQAVDDRIYRPGVLRCAKCNFRLVSSTLHAQSGALTPRDTTEHCPNDGSPMWRVTWQDECHEAERLWEQQVHRAGEAEAALAVVRQSLIDQAAARVDPTMPLLVPDVVARLRSTAECAYAMAESANDRREAHGLMLLCDWQDARRRETGR